jgi:hypothetical protein
VSLPGEPDRLLVVEKHGTIQLVDHAAASLFLDLATPNLVADDDPTAEQGLLSVAPAPDSATSHKLYVFTRANPTARSTSTSSRPSGTRCRSRAAGRC